MDYSKWDLLEDEDDFDIQSELSSNSSAKLGALKLTADDLFNRAEKSCDPYDYKVALKQGYEIILSHLLTPSSFSNERNVAWNQFEISCMMNCACCHLKLMDLNETIRICSDILIRYDRVLTRAQILRVRYFRSYAYYKLNSIESLVLAENDAAVMTDILSSGFTDRDENVADYILHFEALQKEKIRLNDIEDGIKLESECHTFLLTDNLKTREGWCLYVQREYDLSCKWFAKELQKVLEEKIAASLSRKSLLCNLYRGLAKSESALDRHLEAAKAFSAAADHTSFTSELKSLHVRAAALFYKSSRYDESIKSYMKALLLSEEEIDPTDSTSVIESKSKSDVFTATLNVGLGRCNVKVGDYESAIDYLKAGAGYLTDSIFVKPLKPQRKIPFESSLLIKTPTPALPEDVSTLKNRVVSFSVVRVEATHLLNALESLSDAYAAQRDWEKAIYTANNTLDVCRALLSAVSVDEKGCIMSSVKFQDSEEATLIDDIGKNIKNKNFIDNNNNNNTSVTSCPNSGLSTTVLKMTIRDDYLSILTGKIDKSDSNSDPKDFDLERKHLSTALCKRRASTLLAMGHMVKQILYHDINRGTDQDSMKSTGYMFSTIDHNLGNESMRFVGDTADSSDYATTTTAVDRITTLWTDAAEEFKRLGDYNQMVSVNKDIAALWSSLARVEAYSISLILVDNTSTDISLNEHETSAYLPTESNPRNDSSPDNITQHSSKMIPLRSDSNENILRIEAARKASTGWKCTADIARDLCKMASAVGDTNAGLPTGHTTDQSKFDSTVAELELLGWQQVMRCLYNAGLCAMLYDMKESEKLFESAHETKINYHAIAGLLADVEKEQKRNVPSIDLNDEKSSEDTDTFRKLLLKKKENWLNYNTLCCDISYHLGYAYVRSEKIAYAIAEAEMAIEFSLYSAESKLRKRKCWGLLSMGLSASGQIAESEKAFKEIRSVCEDMEVTNLEISQLREFNEYWKDRRNKKHSLSVPSIKSVPVSDRQTPVKVNKLDSAKDNVYKMDKADYDGLVRLMMVSFISLLVLIIAIAISFR